MMTRGVQNKKEILDLLSKNERRIKGMGVKKLGLFGSFLSGSQRADSDVDLLVEFDPAQKTFDHFMELSFLLEDLFERRVELVTTDALSPYIGPHILKEVEYAGFSG